MVIAVVSPSTIPPDCDGRRQFVEKYKRRASLGERWPGAFDREVDLDETPANPIAHVLQRNLPERMNLFTLDQLVAETARAGFELLKAEYFDMNLLTNEYLCDGLEKQEASVVCVKNS